MKQSQGDHRAEGEWRERTMKPAGSRVLRAAVVLTLAAAMNTALAGGGNFARRSSDPTAQAANAAQQQAVGAAEAAQSAMRSMESFRRLSDARQKLLDLQTAARTAAQSAANCGGVCVPNGLQSGGLQAADTALANASDTLDINKLWSGAKAPTQTQASGRMQVEIEQTDNKAILTWKSFNVGRETDVHFNQTAGGDQSKEWIALNRVTDPTLKPSTILGSITAEGQVYLINPNGILFAATSQVNVHSLIASTLDVASRTYVNGGLTLNGDVVERNLAFRQGILAASSDGLNRPSFADFDDSGKQEVFFGFDRTKAGETFKPEDGVFIAKGARINVDSLGLAWFFGHNVTNEGSIHAMDGQIAFAAGRSVYVVDPASIGHSDPDLRGAIVAVDRGGVASNSGSIESQRGNITIVGKSIVNSGLLAVTTSAQANGFISLWAGDFADTSDFFRYGDPSSDPSDPATGSIDNWIALENPSGIYNQPFKYYESSVGQGILRPLINGDVSLATGSVISALPDRLGGYVTFTDFARSYSYADVGSKLVAGNAAALRVYLEKSDTGLKIAGKDGADPTASEIAQGVDNYLRAQPTDRQAWLLYDFTLGDKAAGADQFRSSRIDVMGLNVTLGQGSTILAPGARVMLRAMPASLRQIVTRFDQDIYGDVIPVMQEPTSRVYLEKDSLISVAGLPDVVLPMESNVLSPDWRLNELRDSPLQRDSFLHGFRVPIDIRYGTRLADLSSYYAVRDYSTPQLMTAGGDLSLTAPQIITRSGSSIDLSGGYLRYLDGYVPDTRLEGADGRVYNLATANANANYTGFAGQFDVDHARWGVTQKFNAPLIGGGMRFETGYVQGSNAGALHLGDLYLSDVDASGDPRLGNRPVDDKALAVLVSQIAQLAIIGSGNDLTTPVLREIPEALQVLRLDGSVSSNVVLGPYQTQHLPGSQLNAQNAWLQIPTGASLFVGPQVGHADVGTLVPGSYAIPFRMPVRIGSSSPLPANFVPTSPLADDSIVTVPDRLFSDGTFGQVFIRTHNSPLSIDAGSTLRLGDYGSFSFTGWRADIAGAIVAPAGSINLTAQFLRWPDGLNPLEAYGDGLPANLTQGVFIKSGALLDTHGSWRVQSSDGTTPPPVALNGGTITINSSDVALAPNSLLDVSGGGYLRSDGRLQTANAGSITLVQYGSFGASYLPNSVFEFDGELRGYALGVGGALTLSVTRPITIGDISTPATSGTTSSGTGTNQSKDWNGHLGTEFFSAGGFSSFYIQGGNRVEVQKGAILAPITSAYLWDPANPPPNGGELFDSLQVGAPTNVSAAPIKLSLVSSGTDLTSLTYTLNQITIGGEIHLPALSTLSLAGGSVFVNSVLDVPSGAISIQGNPEVRIGDNARLLARGSITSALAGNGIVRTMQSGGSINLGARVPGNNSPETGFVYIASGSDIDVSGISGTVSALSTPDNDRFSLRTTTSEIAGATDAIVSGDAGSINIAAASGGFVAGGLHATPGGATAHGGFISIDATNGFTPQNGPVTTHRLVAMDDAAVLRSGATFFPAVNELGSKVDALGSPIGGALIGSYSREFFLPLQRINDSGADIVRLSAAETEFVGDSTLRSGRAVVLATNRLINLDGSKVLVASPYVSFGTYDQFLEPLATLPTKASDWTVQADLLDLSGLMLTMGNVSLQSRGDLRFTAGTLNVTGALTFEDARAYPVAGGSYQINAGSVVLNSNGAYHVSDGRLFDALDRSVDPPFSVAGSLTIAAANIEQNGVLIAPEGAISLLATNTVQVGPGSYTSVGLDGALIPISPNQNINPTTTQFGLPRGLTKNITLQAPTVDVSKNAIVDVSGGIDFATFRARYTDPQIGIDLASIQIDALRGFLLANSPTVESVGVTSAADFARQNIDALRIYLTRLDPQSDAGNLGNASLLAAFAGLDSIHQTEFVYENVAADRLIASFKGLSVDQQAHFAYQATGGGDLFAYRFVPGNGGSTDILDKAGTYALLPTHSLTTAPIYDSASAIGTSSRSTVGSQGLVDNSLRVGDSVHFDHVQLSGDGRVLNGDYVLLPAHFALLPGGIAIRTERSGYAELPKNTVVLADGAEIVGGYRSVANATIRDSLFSQFRLIPQSTIRAYSAFDNLFLNTELPQLAAQNKVAVPRLPYDGGQLILSATKDLKLDGIGKFDAPANALVGSVEIVAPKIAVLGKGQVAPGDDFLSLAVGTLNDFKIGSLLLGGTRATTLNGEQLTTAAQQVYVQTLGGDPLHASEIIVAGLDSVEIGHDSVLEANGAARNDTSNFNVAGTGALLLASNRVGLVVQRTVGAGSPTKGNLLVGDLTKLQSSGALALDSSGAVQTSATTDFQTTDLTLSSQRVSIGDAPAGTAGTILSAQTLANIAKAQSLRIRATDGIAFYGSGVLGGETTGKLTIDTPYLLGFGVAGDKAGLRASELTWTNTVGSVAPAVVSGIGTLLLTSDQLNLDDGIVSVFGFADTRIASTTITARQSAALHITGAATIATDLLSVNAGRNYVIDAAGALNLAPLIGPSAVTVEQLGGRLRLSGTSVMLNTRIDLPVGVLDVTATGGALIVGDSAVLSARGVSQQFFDVTRSIDGGAINLTATGGDLSVAQNATLDVSAPTQGGDGGALYLLSDHTAIVNGKLLGAGGANGVGGTFEVRAAGIETFTNVNRTLEAGGFTGSRSVHVDQGDLILDAGNLSAHEVNLRTDSGSVILGGSINAQGDAAHPNGGRVSLIAGSVQLNGGATINADAFGGATEFPAASGHIDIEALTGNAVLAAGSNVHALGGSSNGGALTITAPRTIADVAVELNGATAGRELIVRGLATYTAGDTSQATTLRSDAETWMTHATQIKSRLGHDAVIAPAMSVQSSGDLTVSNPIDLHGWAGEGLLQLTAARDLRVNASISDGFDSATSSGNLLGGRSASISLEAARNITIGTGSQVTLGAVTSLPGGYLARPVSYVPSSNVVLVRTGTGDISIAAGGNLNLGGESAFRESYGRLLAHTRGSTLNSGFPLCGGCNADPTIDWISIDTLSSGTYRDLNWGIYTAGQKVDDVSGFSSVLSSGGKRIGDYPLGGGDVIVRVAGSVDATPSADFITAWQYRYGRAQTSSVASEARVVDQSSWSIVFPAVRTLVGALGQGSVDVIAHGDIHDLTAAVPTTGQQLTAIGGKVDSAALNVRGGGDLIVRADAFFGGVYMDAQGRESITATDKITEDLGTLNGSYWGLDGRVHPGFQDGGMSLVIGDTQLDVRARTDIKINGLTDWAQIQQARGNTIATNTTTYFSSYTTRSTLDFASAGGDIVYSGAGATPGIELTAKGVQADGGQPLITSGAFAFPTPPSGLLPLIPNSDDALAPAKASFIAYSGNLKGSFSLAPDPNSNLELLANGNISQSAVVTSNRSLDYWRTAIAPLSITIGPDGVSTDGYPTPGILNNYWRGFVPLQENNRTPSLVYARNDILNSTLQFGATGRVYAGRDLLGDSLNFEHHVPIDSSLIMAGRDIGYAGPVSTVLKVQGPGRLDVVAGRNIQTPGGNSSGWQSVGNGIGRAGSQGQAYNPALPSTGANISILAGAPAQEDFSKFIAAYLDPQAVEKPIHDYLPALRDYLADTQGLSDAKKSDVLDDAAVFAEFLKLPHDKQAPFLYQVLFTELKETGIAFNAEPDIANRNYRRGREALDRLFPQSGVTRNSVSGGDIQMQNSNLETLAGGDIALLAPYGGVYLDIPGGSPETKDKDIYGRNQTPIVNGVVTRRGGHISVLTAKNTDLINSRVFTLQGGDILMWTTHGDITAGDGSKRLTVNPPPFYTLNINANLSLDVFGLQTGSGIGVLDALGTGGKKGRIDLIAPEGTVDAGEAGIRVQGDINIAALRVVGADNIQATGIAVGIPKAVAVNAGALSAASAAAANVGEAAAELASKAQPAVRDLPSIITVEVLGFGEP